MYNVAWVGLSPKGGVNIDLRLHLSCLSDDVLTLQDRIGELKHPPQAVVFAPHPDDETIACGGTICKRVAAGWIVHVVFATDGSQSHKAVLGIVSQPTPSELVGVRAREAIAATSILGVAPENVTFLHYPDTTLREHEGSFRRVVAEYAGSVGDVDEVYIPHDRRELNADHCVTGSVAYEEFCSRQGQARVLRYVVWDEQVESEFQFCNRPSDVMPMLAGETLIREDIAPFLATKVAALFEHRSQTELISPLQNRTVLPNEMVRRLVGRDYEEFWLAGE